MHDDRRTSGPLQRGIQTAFDAANTCIQSVAQATDGQWQRFAARSTTRSALAGKLANLGAIICTLAICGCAANVPQPESRSEPMRSGVPAAEAVSHMCHIDRALLAPARAPDCGFGRSNLKTLDPDQWAQLKLEFEKKCYQRAEKTLRERLRQLQVATRCGIEQASR